LISGRDIYDTGGMLMSDSRSVLLLMDFQHGIVERIADPAVVDAADRAAKAARRRASR